MSYYLIIDNKIKEDKSQLGLETSPSSLYHICGLMPDDKASLAKIDEYIEMLYDDMPKKVRGSGFILKVTCDKDNLEELSSSGIIKNINHCPSKITIQYFSIINFV